MQIVTRKQKNYEGLRSVAMKPDTVEQDIRRINRNRIYQQFISQRRLSKRDLVNQLQLSLPTVTQNINELVELQLIRDSGTFSHTGGRRARAYSFLSDARLAVGLDITKNNITAVVISLDGTHVLEKQMQCKYAPNEGYFRKLGDFVNKLISDGRFDTKRILGVGIGIPALVTTDNQTVFYGKIIDSTGITLSDFSQYIPYPCALYNDAKAAGYADIRVSENMENAFYVMLSNNVGGCILINSQVYIGENVSGGEVGHMTIVPGGLPCYCGQKGCVEAYCNARLLSDAAGGNLDNFFTGLKSGNLEFRKIWEKYLLYLSITVNNLRMLFDCKVILGGYVGTYMDNYIDDLKKLALARNTFETNADYLQVCRYKKHSIASGAALHYIDNFIQSL